MTMAVQDPSYPVIHLIRNAKKIKSCKSFFFSFSCRILRLDELESLMLLDAFKTCNLNLTNSSIYNNPEKEK